LHRNSHIDAAVDHQGASNGLAQVLQANIGFVQHLEVHGKAGVCMRDLDREAIQIIGHALLNLLSGGPLGIFTRNVNVCLANKDVWRGCQAMMLEPGIHHLQAAVALTEL
jgi:hypothetical protein